MKKIGIITIPDYNNYGNRLQNYAVKRFFENKGYDVVTLEMNDPKFEKYKARKFKLRLKKNNMLGFVFLFEMVKGGIHKAKRDLRFEKFTKKYLNVRYIPEYTKKQIENLNKEFSYFSLGSDQIWHPYVNTTPNLYFASFTEEDKKIYFSPSFGVEKIPNDYAELLKERLKNAKHLTVREVAGAKIIKEVLGKEAQVLFDPTLLIEKKEWDLIAKRPKGMEKGKYIASCFLGPKNEEYREKIKEINKENGISVFNLADPKMKNGYITGPSEFVYTIKNAEIVLTDSFHAVVFCILYHKQFIVFSRLNDKGEPAGLDSRIDDLLRKLHLTEYKYERNKKWDLEKIDFNFADEVIEKEKDRVNKIFAYLK